ncbi:MAG: HAD-IIIA family hydrolase, partial [Chitinophagaceae bacterium]
TGGAILLASSKTTEENVLITNGDTIFKIDIDKLAVVHHENTAGATLALKPMIDFDRYGIVEINEENTITNFREKQFCKQGNINGGTYILNVKSFLKKEWPAKFSFEKDFLETQQFRLFGSVQEEYFIDIGIPEDYNKAQTEFAKPQLDLNAINNTWTIFIDRDGVINYEKKDDYILNWDEFRFYDGVKEAFKILNNKVGKIIIVSNQRGVGRELMSETDLNNIHQYMTQEIVFASGRIDHIYYCTSTDNKHPNRKPNPGMAFQAKNDFPEINLDKSIMIGNKLSDMRFGRNAGIYTVFVATTNPDISFPHPDIDYRFDSLPDFVKAL